MNLNHSLGFIVQLFFNSYLVAQKGLSQNSIATYSHCLKFFFNFCCRNLNKKIDRLSLIDLDDKIVLDFLDHLETQRQNSPATRNNRLAALRTFFRFVATEEPIFIDRCKRVCSIKNKKTPHKVVGALDNDQVKSFMDSVDSQTILGKRDFALILFMYNTGARVQEIVDLKITDLHLNAPFMVSLTGKGKKERQIPLWDETINAINGYLQAREQHDIYHQEKLFLNSNANPIARFGINHIIKKIKSKALKTSPTLNDKIVTPHTFRHTTALHLIQSGNDITIVKEWLGHADINTTHLYVEIDIQMKRKALETYCPPLDPIKSKQAVPKWLQPDILQWLEKLSRDAKLCGVKTIRKIAIPA